MQLGLFNVCNKKVKEVLELVLMLVFQHLTKHLAVWMCAHVLVMVCLLLTAGSCY